MAQWTVGLGTRLSGAILYGDLMGAAMGTFAGMRTLGLIIEAAVLFKYERSPIASIAHLRVKLRFNEHDHGSF